MSGAEPLNSAFCSQSIQQSSSLASASSGWTGLRIAASPPPCLSSATRAPHIPPVPVVLLTWVVAGAMTTRIHPSEAACRVAHFLQRASAKVRSGSTSPVRILMNVALVFTSAMSMPLVSTCQAHMIVNVMLALKGMGESIATKPAASCASMGSALEPQTTSASATSAGLGPTVVKTVDAMGTADALREWAGAMSANT